MKAFSVWETTILVIRSCHSNFMLTKLEKVKWWLPIDIIIATLLYLNFNLWIYKSKICLWESLSQYQWWRKMLLNGALQQFHTQRTPFKWLNKLQTFWSGKDVMILPNCYQLISCLLHLILIFSWTYLGGGSF